MGLSTKRRAVLTRALGACGWAVAREHTAAMMGGDVVETTVLDLVHQDGRVASLTIVTELGFNAMFPPVLRAQRESTRDAKASALLEEWLWDDNDVQGVARFCAAI